MGKWRVIEIADQSAILPRCQFTQVFGLHPVCGQDLCISYERCQLVFAQLLYANQHRKGFIGMSLKVIGQNARLNLWDEKSRKLLSFSQARALGA